jgi:hypothetical protein
MKKKNLTSRRRLKLESASDAVPVARQAAVFITSLKSRGNHFRRSVVWLCVHPPTVFSGGSVDKDENGEALPPNNAIHTSIPRRMVRQLRNYAGHPKQDDYIRLGVKGRGDKDEDGWVADEISCDDGEDLVPIYIAPGEILQFSS